MSRSLNRVQIIGNLGADPELRTTTSGARVATLSVATSRRWTDRQGEPKEKTEWHRVIFWEKLAEVAERYLKKGDRVYVEGSIEYRQYEDREGQTRYITEIRGREMIMLGGRGEGADFVPPDSVSRETESGGGQASGDDYEEFSNESLTPAGDDDLPF
jgi:single-strand DNA-binding protein